MMEKDKSQEQYDKSLQELKEEKMTWDFEDFLKKTEKEKKTLPVPSKTTGGSIPGIFWMAASVVLLISLGIFFNYEGDTNVKKQDDLVQNEIRKQRDSFHQESNLAINAIADTVTIKSDTLLIDSANNVERLTETDIMDQILPRRGRIKKELRPRYTQVDVEKKSAPSTLPKPVKYQSNYVIINGQKIENEQEAIDLTKYSFRILSENVSKTVDQTDVFNDFTNN